MNPAALKANIGALKSGTVIVNTDKFTDRDLESRLHVQPTDGTSRPGWPSSSQR